CPRAFRNNRLRLSSPLLQGQRSAAVVVSQDVTELQHVTGFRRSCQQPVQANTAPVTPAVTATPACCCMTLTNTAYRGIIEVSARLRKRVFLFASALL